MYPFWEMVVAPLIKASGARRVLEIGALRGEATVKMFDQLGPDSELHVIDPLPQFDPDEHARQFPGRYIFHRDLSLNVLPDLPAVDVALVDGDHNWYTVFHELEHLDRAAREAGQPLPILFCHDVGWPYGHRDLYYEPSQIPDEYRQEWDRAGMAPGFHHLLPEGGFNVGLANAVNGGGPRNGVRRAVEDFLEGYDRPFRELLLPFYYGLSIIVDQQRLDETPEVKQLLDHFETHRGRDRLLKLAEKIRIDEQVHVHNMNRHHEREKAAFRDRWLGLLKASLLDEPYLENEVRLEYMGTLPAGAVAEQEKLRDPARTLEVRYKRLAQARTSGRSSDVPTGAWYFPYTDMGRPALDHLDATIADLQERGVEGDLVECGVGRGGGGILMRACMDAYDLTDRHLWMVDPFAASPSTAGGEASEPDEQSAQDARRTRMRADLNQVRDGFARFDLFDDRTRFVQGAYRASLADAPIGPIALLRVGISATADLRSILMSLLPKMSEGGTVVVEGVSQPRVEKALATVHTEVGVTDLSRVDWNTVSWTVTRAAAVPSDDQPRETASLHRVPLAPTVPTDRCALSVVVVFYNMRREAERTLRSLSRTYQQGVDDLDYEVIVVDNGSDPDQALTPEEVAAYGHEFRLLPPADHTPPSPTVALNRGIAASRGEAVAVMIDGAHVLTPGVFRHALAAMAVYEPAVVAVQQWYVGPGQQGDAQQTGYDQAAEDVLFRRIKWPTDGYRLFEIGHFIGDRDWFDGIIESNCLFVPRAVLEQVGGFDDSFDTPGGGYTNLELFERVHSHPGVNPASILGEGTFHQFHGGTTTNVADEAVRRDRITSYRQDFADLRGRPLTGLNKPVHYVGSMDTKAARRTRSRREFLLAFDPGRDPVTTTVSEPQPVPEELKFAAIEALWDHQAWRETTWLGRPVRRYPTDLHTYQELVASVRPAHTILVGDDDGLAGRALYLASLADQLDHGSVVALGSPTDRPEHPRITWVEGTPEAPDTVQAVCDLVGDRDALVMIGLGPVQRVIATFSAYAPLVPVGGYVVIENTVVNGRPVASGFGPGPHEAVVQILGTRREFVPDVAWERYTITFNKGGFLRRMAAP